MTLGHMLSQMGFGTKTISSYPDYHSGHSHHPQYWYDPHQGHDHHDRDLHAVSKHGHHHSHKKNNAALSALTLLAFLFFLHILQQCLREHMQSMTEPQITIMTAGRETEDKIAKNANIKIDKRTSIKEKGIDRFDYDVGALESTTTELYSNPFTRIKTEEYTPKNMKSNKRIQANHGYRNASFPGIVSSMDQL